MKKIGIVCDNYKVEKFKQSLKEKYPTLEVTTHVFSKQNKLTLIKFSLLPSEIDEVRKICTVCEIEFGQSN